MHQFASHISKALNNVFLKKAPTNVKGWKVEIFDFIISKYETFMRKKMINNNELHIFLCCPKGILTWSWSRMEGQSHIL
jgi:hypothetical protein